MAAKVETTVREWSTPVKKIVEGTPPKPEDNPTTIHGEAYRSNISTVTPTYKYDLNKSSQELTLGSTSNLPEAVGDYKVKETQDHYKLQMIDPKISSNANMPYLSQSVSGSYRRNLDFPSEHSKRSFLKLDPLEKRRIRSVETRPITTSAYLTESVDRHRDMEASRLREYLKAKEGDANKPWHKPNWPGPKERDDKELQEIKKTIETLQKATQSPKKNADLDELARLNEKLLERSRARRTDYKLVNPEIVKTSPDPIPQNIKENIREILESRTSNDYSINSTIPQNDRSGYVTDASSATWQFSTHSFSPRSVVSINGGSKADDGLLQTQKQPWPYMPAQLGSVADSAQSTLTREFTENYSRRIDRYASLPALDNGNIRGTLIKIKDDKPRGIMKRKDLETKTQMMYADEPKHVISTSHMEQKQNVVPSKPKVTETVHKFEEHKRTEEIERRVQRKERKEKKRRGHRSYHHSGGYESQGYGHQNGSLTRHNYSPSHESYMRTITTRRERDGQYHDNGRHHMMNGGLDYERYGSLSDSLRRGDMKYDPNGEIREVYHTSHDGRVHKSYSTRDVFDTGNYDDYRSSPSQYRRSSHQQNGPLVEFPPTLPRADIERDAPMPPPHRGRSTSNDFYKPISKSRSYADWDEGRGFEHAIRRREDDISRLENEFRDSLLMPMPRTGGNMYERDHRTEQIPGGYETYDRHVKANSGRRLNRDGNPTQFSEASQEYSFKREVESDRPR